MRTEPAGSFSVTVPAHGDEALLDATLSSLVTADDAPSEVLVVVDPGDPMAREVAARAAARHPELVDVVDEAASVLSPRAAAAAWWRARASPAAAFMRTLRARRAPTALAETDRQGVQTDGTASFSVTVPAHRDEGVLEATVAEFVTGDDEPFEVVIVVTTDDPATREVAERVAGRHPHLVSVAVEVAPAWPPLRVPSVHVPLAAIAAGEAAKRAAGWIAAGLQNRVVSRVLAVVVAASVVALAINTGSPLYVLYVGVAVLLTVLAGTTLVWMMSAWRTPAALTDSGMKRDALAPAHSFSLIVPARHEEPVLEATLTGLMRTTHPAFEVLVVVGDDDPGTRRVAEEVADRHPGRMRIVVDDSQPKSKPKALNAALPHCSGAITGVFDAEDDVHPELLERVDQCFQKTHADIVQAGVQLMNFRSSWLTVRNVLEYYFWFRSRLHFHARQGFIPLGGNTVFIRTEVLRSVSGWDPECLAEDCELGVRLSALGARTAVFYEPDLVTREECPPTLGAFARQRTRWNQGYLQTLSKRYWRQLPLRQRALGAYTLAMPHLMALVWLTIPVAIATAVVVKAPVPITLVSFLPALPMLSMLAVEFAGLNDFCRTYGERASARDYGRLVLGLLLYHAVLAFAAVRAVARELRGDRGWEKTAHLGLHLSQEAAGARSNGSPRQPAPLGPPLRRRPAGCAVLEPSAVALAVTEESSPAVGTGHGNGNGDGHGNRNGHGNGNGDGHGNGNGNGHGNGNGNGDGHGAGSIRVRDDLCGGVHGEPLWTRLGLLPENGAVAERGAVSTGAAAALSPQRWRLALAAHADLLVLLVVLAGVALVQATNMLHWPNTQFDEGTYVANAWAVGHGTLAPYTYSYGHPPLAWLLIALWTWVNGIFSDGTYTLDTGRQLMFVVTMVSCSLLFTLARRLNIGRVFAAAAVIVFALSPVALYYHRAVLLDNIAIAWALAAFVLALSPGRRLWAFAGSGACFALAALSKETILVLLPALLLLAARNADGRTRRYCLTLFGSFFALIVLSYPLYATLKGELLPGEGHVSLIGYTIVQLFTREGTGSLFDAESETHAIVNYWLRLDPWLLLVSLVLAPIALARRNTRAVALAFVIQVVMVLRPGYLPNMYVLGLLPFAALIVAGTSDMLWRKSRARSSSALAWSARAGLAALALLAVFIVAPRWVETDRHATSVKLDGPRRAAERWLVENLGRDDRVIVGDEFWLYLVEHGFDHRPVRGGFFSRRIVVYWPLDYDPAVQRRFPNGWRDFDYVVSTEAVRVTTELTPTTLHALEHSHVVADFGRGDQRIEVRAIGGAQPPDEWW